jgi:hypothetical protein
VVVGRTHNPGQVKGFLFWSAMKDKKKQKQRGMDHNQSSKHAQIMITHQNESMAKQPT